MLSDSFSGTFCINLERRPDRLDLFLAEYRRAFGDSSAVTLFPAVDSRGIPPAEIPPRFSDIWSPGAFGTKLSHMAVIREARRQRLDSVLILEDDVTFHPLFRGIFPVFHRNLPDDWDWLFLGINHFAFAPEPVAEFVRRVRGYATHAYAVRSRMYDRILEADRDDPIDVIYYDLQPQVRTYGVEPRLCSQRPGHSDVENRVVDYRGILGEW